MDEKTKIIIAKHTQVGVFRNLIIEYHKPILKYSIVRITTSDHIHLENFIINIIII